MIKRQDVENEIIELEKILEKYNIMTPKACKELENRGYHREALGTGDTAYTRSKLIRIQNIRSKCYLNGEYLVIGICNKAFSKGGQLYRGYVKKVID